MASLPDEVWIKIGQNLGKPDLFALSRTSQYFSVIAERLLYANITLVRLSTSAAHNGWEHKLVQALARRPQRCALVHTLALRVPSFGGTVGLPRVVDMYPGVLPGLAAFCGLRALTLTGVHVDARCRDVIFSLEHLECLALESCTTYVPPAGPVRFPRNNRLTELAVRMPKSPTGWHAFAPPGLQTFIGDKAPGAFLTGLVPPAFNRLTKLAWLRPHALDDVVHFLTHAPQLQALSFCALARPNLSDAQINSLRGALPHLVEYTGPAGLGGVFVGGRPVRRAKVMFSRDTPRDVLCALQSSHGPVEELSVCGYVDPRGVYDLDAVEVLSYAPTTLDFLHWEGSNLENAFQVLSRITELRVLEILGAGDRDRARFYKDKVRAYARAVPSLEEIVFLNRERWTRLERGGWERYVLDRGQDYDG